MLFAVAQLGVSAEHTALAKVLGAPGAGAHLLAAGLQFFGQLFQTEQLCRALCGALGGQLDGSGGLRGIEPGLLGGLAGSLHGLVGLGAQGGSGIPGAQFGGIVPGLGSCQLELQAALVHLLVHVHGGGAQQLGHGIGHGVHTVGHLFQSIQLTGQVRGRKGGHHHVGGVAGVQDAHEDKAHHLGDHLHKARDHGVNGLHHHNGANAPQKGELQADISADVEGEVAVIPPPGVVELVERPAAHQLQYAGQDHAAEIEQQQVVCQRRKGEQHDNHAKAVDGADRAVQKAAVHQLAGGNGGIDDLQAPAQAGVDQEKRQDLIQRKAADHGVDKKGHLTPPLRRQRLPPQPSSFSGPWARSRSRRHRRAAFWRSGP